MSNRTKIVLAAVGLLFVLNCMCLASLATAVVSGAASYGLSYWTLTMYAGPTNEYVQKLDKECLKRPDRKGRSHRRPRDASY